MSDSNVPVYEKVDACSAKTENVIDDKLARVIEPVAWKISPVGNVAVFEALPPASKDRAIRKEADTFASTGRNVFDHYVTPVLSKRRELLLASGVTKKKYPKTAAQLWPTLPLDQSFFWNEAAKELRQCMKQNILSPKECLIHAGRLGEKENYIWRAEIAVATYLDIPAPPEATEATVTLEGSGKEQKENVYVPPLSCAAVGKLTLVAVDTITLFPAEQKTAFSSVLTTADIDTSKVSTTGCEGHLDQAFKAPELLNTLPDHFQHEPSMVFSHFAHYDYDEVRKAEGKHQTAMLRQLADRFDKTGKVLFYYYTVPRLCTQVYPPSKGETVTSKAAEIWRSLPGREKDKWLNANSKLKKQLGDGAIVGLETLQLDSLDPEVLKLHGFAQVAIQEHEEKGER